MSGRIGWCRQWVYGAIRHLNKNVDDDAFFFPDGCESPECKAMGHPSPNVRCDPTEADLIAAAPLLLGALRASKEPHEERGGPHIYAEYCRRCQWEEVRDAALAAATPPAGEG